MNVRESPEETEESDDSEELVSFVGLLKNSCATGASSLLLQAH